MTDPENEHRKGGGRIGGLTMKSNTIQATQSEVSPNKVNMKSLKF